MVRLNKIYTKTGDKGQTRLAGGHAVRKNDIRLACYGTIDELSACMGLAREHFKHDGSKKPELDAPVSEITLAISRIQNELFNLGSHLSMMPEDRRPDSPMVMATHIQKLESELDAWNDKTYALKSFILPGGGMAAAQIHVARTVCRRAERLLVSLIDSGADVSEEALPYVNRLSDWLFVLSRHASRLFKQPEELWQPANT